MELYPIRIIDVGVSIDCRSRRSDTNERNCSLRKFRSQSPLQYNKDPSENHETHRSSRRLRAKIREEGILQVTILSQSRSRRRKEIWTHRDGQTMTRLGGRVTLSCDEFWRDLITHHIRVEFKVQWQYSVFYRERLWSTTLFFSIDLQVCSISSFLKAI